MASDKQRIFAWFYRQSLASSPFKFDDWLYDAAMAALGKTEMDAESFVEANYRMYWNWLKAACDEDRTRGLQPTFRIVDDSGRRLSWAPLDLTLCSSVREKRRMCLLKDRPFLLGAIDRTTSREYEALAAVVCRALRSERVYLTPSGNERGIDFFASIPMVANSHVFFGASSPLRIVGQCKKHSSPIEPKDLGAFCDTLENVKRQEPRTELHVPSWFREDRGPVVGWIIAHSGFHSGASFIAKNHGIFLADSRDVVEVLAASRSLGADEGPEVRVKMLGGLIRAELG